MGGGREGGREGGRGRGRELTSVKFIPIPHSGSNKEALAVAHASGADFIRAEGYVFSHVADEGWMDSCAGELLRYRKMIDAEKVMVFTDIKKKHSLVQIFPSVSYNW